MGDCLSSMRPERGPDEAGATFPEVEEIQPQPGQPSVEGEEIPGEIPVELQEESGEGAPVEPGEDLVDHDRAVVRNDQLVPPDGNDLDQTGAQHQESIDTNPEEPAVNSETVVWIEGPGISGNGLYAPETAIAKIKDFTALQDIDPVMDFIENAKGEIMRLSPEALFEDRRKLIWFLKHKSDLNSPEEALSWPENEQLRPSLVSLMDSWDKAAARILHQPEVRNIIFGFLRGASNKVAEGCLITMVSDMVENYKRISSNWKSGDNWEKQLKQCMESKIKSQFTGTIDDSHMSEAEGLLGDLVNHTPIYVIGKVENLLDGSSGKGFLMFTTPLEIDAKKLKKVDTNRLLSAIDQRGKTVIPEIREMLTVKEGDAVKFPISIQTVRPKQPLFDTPSTVEIPKTATIPTNFEFKQEIKTPNDSFCVDYSRSGRLLHSGNYQLSGLDFTPNLPTSERHSNISLFEHKSSLYMLQDFNKNYHVHVINLDNRSVSQSIITFTSSSSYLQRMSVTDKHILIAHCLADTIKVYSTTTYNHMFDIKDTSIFNSPVGLAVLGDTLVVGDCSNNKVVNITISKTPEIRWSTTEINRPFSIEVKEDSQIILVGSYKIGQIHILTLQGEKLSTLDLPQCSRMNDISTYQNQLAVAEGSDNKIKVYEMKFD